MCEKNVEVQSKTGQLGSNSKTQLHILRRAVSREFLGRLYIGWATKINDEVKKKAIECFGHDRVTVGPVKSWSRLSTKQEEDWAKYKYHMAANIRDYCRLSIEFGSEEALTAGRRKLLDSRITGDWFEPLREKNGFHFQAKNYDGYRDIKVLGVFLGSNVKDRNGHQIRMIIEIQLILSSFLHYKTYQHILYDILRGDYDVAKSPRLRRVSTSDKRKSIFPGDVELVPFIGKPFGESRC